MTERSNKPTRKKLFVCFIGIDGAGKTTIARKLVGFLQDRNLKVKYTWNKYEPWTLKPVMKIGRAMFLRGQDEFRDYASYQESKQKAFRVPVIPALFRAAYFLEYPLHVFFTIGLPRLMNRSIVCDRYYHDMIAGTSSEFGFSGRRTGRLLRLFSRLLPKPDLVFWVDAPEEVAFLRKNDIPSVEFLRKKRAIYRKMAETVRPVVIDGCQDPRETETMVFEKVGALLS